MNNNYGYPINTNEFDYNSFLKRLGINSQNVSINMDSNESVELSNANGNNLFGSYEGYIKGNLFKNLYSNYKNYNLINYPIDSEQAEALLNLNQMHFGMHEANLYLDVFPNDIKMMQEFGRYRDGYNRLLKEYETKYGPLNISDEYLNSIPFAWENNEFPWEGGNN